MDIWHVMERIYSVFNGTKKEFEIARELNVKKEKYYLQKFVLNGNKSKNGNENKNENENKIEKQDSSKDFFDYTQVCWHCGKDVYKTDCYKMCPNINCQTKYCDKCWENVFEKQSMKDQPASRSTALLSICKHIKCYMCKETEYKDFSIIDKNNQIIFESKEYKEQENALQDYRDQQQWELESIDVASESSDSDVSLDENDGDNDDDDESSDESSDSSEISEEEIVGSWNNNTRNMNINDNSNVNNDEKEEKKTDNEMKDNRNDSGQVDGQDGRKTDENENEMKDITIWSIVNLQLCI